MTTALADKRRLVVGTLAFDQINLAEAAHRVLELARSPECSLVVTSNVDHVVRAESDPEFAGIVRRAALVTADGMPIVWASHLSGCPLPARVTGADLVPTVAALAAASGQSLFLMGGMPGEAELAAHNLRAKHPGLIIAGTYSPPFGFERDPVECRKMVSLINESRTDILCLGVGSPKQEKWLDAHRAELACGVALGVGATIAFIAGTLDRAPPWMRGLGLEWVFRLSREPKRLFWRYAHDAVFVLIMLRCLMARWTPS